MSFSLIWMCTIDTKNKNILHVIEGNQAFNGKIVNKMHRIPIS